MFEMISGSGFKSWDELPPTRLAPVTGLFGSNSSGKTSLIQMLLLMKQTAESLDRLQTLNFGDTGSLVELGSLRDVLFDHQLDRPLRLTYSWRPTAAVRPADPLNPGTVIFTANTIKFEVAVRSGQRERPVVEYFEYAATPDTTVRMAQASRQQGRRQAEYTLSATVNGNADYLRRTQGRPWPLPRPVKCYGFPDEVSAYFQNAGFTSELELELDRNFTNNLFYLGPLRSRPSRQYRWQGTQPSDVGVSGERAVEALLASADRGRSNTRSYNARGYASRRITVEQHVAEWLKQLSLIEEFAVRRLSDDADIYRVLVRQHVGASEVSLTDVGIGVSQILPVLVLLAWVPEGATVLLEQPELHLHPAVQSGLADILVEAATVRRVQVIIESHSEHLLRRLQLRTAEQDIAAENIALYFCARDGDRSRLADLKLNSAGEIENWPAEFFGDPLGETAAITRAAIRRRQQQMAG